MTTQAEEKIRLYNVETGEYAEVEKIRKTEDEWRQSLSKEAYHIAREHGTERPFSGEYNDKKEDGVYVCVACGTHLFSSKHKFDSGTGWPSYWRPVAKENIGTSVDKSLFMTRTEVHCPRCGAHLGHVFEDGPDPTGLRYCINSAALDFQPMEDQKLKK